MYLDDSLTEDELLEAADEQRITALLQQSAAVVRRNADGRSLADWARIIELSGKS